MSNVSAKEYEEMMDRFLRLYDFFKHDHVISLTIRSLWNDWGTWTNPFNQPAAAPLQIKSVYERVSALEEAMSNRIDLTLLR